MKQKKQKRKKKKNPCHLIIWCSHVSYFIFKPQERSAKSYLSLCPSLITVMMGLYGQKKGRGMDFWSLLLQAPVKLISATS